MFRPDPTFSKIRGSGSGSATRVVGLPAGRRDGIDCRSLVDETVQVCFVGLCKNTGQSRIMYIQGQPVHRSEENDK